MKSGRADVAAPSERRAAAAASVHPARSSGSIRIHLLVLAGYVGLAALISLPLPFCFGNCLGSSEDPIYTAWAFSWVERSLLEGAGPLFDGNIFLPYRRTLALGEPNLTHALAAMPFIAASGNPVVGHNVAVLLCYAMAGFGAYLLAWNLVGRRKPALLAGLVLAASPFFVHNAFNVQTLSAYWLTYLLLAVELYRSRPTWPRAVLLWSVVAALVPASIYYTVYGGLGAAIFVLTGLLVSRHRWGWKHARRLLVAAPPFLGIVAWFLAPYWHWHKMFGISRGMGEASLYSMTWRNFVMVPPGNLLHERLGLWVAGHPWTSAAFPGVTAGSLALLGAVAAVRAGRRGSSAAEPWLRDALPFVGLLVGSLVLCFGPSAKVLSHEVPLPYQLLFWVVPGMRALRTPNRFAALIMISIAVLAAAGAAILERRLERGRRRHLGSAIWIALVLGVAVEFATYPFPGTAQRITDRLPEERREVLEWLSGQPRPTRVLELPMKDAEASLLTAALSGQPMVNGYASFLPPLYEELAQDLGTFPSERALALIGALSLDFVILDTRGCSPEIVDEVLRRPAGLSVERNFGRYLILRPSPARPSREILRIDASWDSPAEPGGPACPVLTVTNPLARDLPLYPLHTVEATVRLPARRTYAAPLPLWLSPAEPVRLALCAPSPGERSRPADVTITGRIFADDGEREFEVRATGPVSP